jgi:folate-binding protein YgfZ
MSGHIAELSRRGVVAVSGADAEKFLNDLITCAVPAEGGAAYGGLLTPQGKILFDFIVFRDRGRFLFDLPRVAVADFIKRLTFYRLRAKVDIADLSDDHIAVAAWRGDAPPILDGPVAPDPRLVALGFRAIVPAGADMAADHDEAREAGYDAHRIALAVPEGGVDFAFGESFPHDAAMDQLAGLDFGKGCYVGQEVVSRMQHRGTARRRFVVATGAAPLPPAGTLVTAGERALGALGSSSGTTGLALVRLDRAKESVDAGTTIVADGVAIALALPAWAAYAWPAAATVDGD